jgi:glycosyltransferase involved in cell wall biosynthesis
VKRLLWVTAIEPCFDAGGGGQIRQAHLIDAVADHFEVHLLLAGRLHDQRVRGRLASVREVPVGLPAEPGGQMRRRLRDIRWEMVERQPDEVARHRSIRRALQPVIAEVPEPDIVCVEYLGLAPLLPRRRRAVWALTLHNLPSEMARHNARIAPGRRQRMMQALEQRNSRRIEAWAAGAYDLVMTVSPEDAALLPAGATIVPNGVDTDRFHPSPVPTNRRVVFTGALHTLPNRDGVQWFCSEVWPRVRARVPDATLDVVGARPPADVVALGRADGVRVDGDVPDTVPFLEQARVAVVPLRIGTGSRLKALEAMAAGRPVVGTTVGLGGLDVQAGRDALVADNAAAFADAVVRCLTGDELAGSLATQGRKLVGRYSWKRIGAGYAALLGERIAPRSASSPSTSSDTIATN